MSTPTTSPSDVCVTAPGCLGCGRQLPTGRARRFCCPACRQAYRRRHQPETPEVLALPPGRSRLQGTVYECPECETRYLAEQWCPDCSQPCRRLGPGGNCPLLRGGDHHKRTRPRKRRPQPTLATEQETNPSLKKSPRFEGKPRRFRPPGPAATPPHPPKPLPPKPSGAATRPSTPAPAAIPATTPNSGATTAASPAPASASAGSAPTVTNPSPWPTYSTPPKRPQTR